MNVAMLSVSSAWWFLILPGLVPAPWLTSCIRLAMVKFWRFAALVILNFTCRDFPTTVELMSLRDRVGKFGIGFGSGTFSSPMQAKPW